MHTFITPPEGEPGAASSASGSANLQHLDRLFEISGTLLLELCSDGQILRANPSAERIFANRGENFFESVEASDLSPLSDSPSESTFSLQCRLPADDEVERWYEFRGERVVTADQEERIFLLGRDITDRKHAEAEVRLLHEEINRSRPKQDLGRMAGRVAHNFNNILGAIVAYTDLARRELRKDEPVQEYLRQVLLAGERAKNLVRQVLTFSRRQTQKRSRVHLTSLVDEVLQLMRPTIPPSITVKVEAKAQSDVVMADSLQIHEVLANLVTNAIHAMEILGGELAVSIFDEDCKDDAKPMRSGCETHPRVFVSVRDTGHGIDEQTQRRLFEPFFTTRASSGGTGLGLTVVQAIMADHGGSVTVRSEPGQGATFLLSFPKAQP